MATGISFFNEAQSQYKGDPANIVNLSWGYAAQCGYAMLVDVSLSRVQRALCITLKISAMTNTVTRFAAVIMMWIAVVVFSIIAIINRNKPREVMVVQEQYYVMNEAV